MSFDPTTAKEFNPSSAKPVDSFDPSTAKVFDPSSAVADGGQTPSLFDSAISTLKALPQKAGDFALGVVEQPAAGLGWLGAMGAATSGAAIDMALNKASGGRLGVATPSGMNAADRFIDETNAIYEKIEGKIPFSPETESGKAILEFISEDVIMPAVQAVGDFAYGKARTFDTVMRAAGMELPFAEERAAGAGAIGQATAMLAALKGAKKAGEPAPGPKLTGDPAKDFVLQYPKTAQRVEASHIGDSPLKEAIQAEPQKHVMRVVEDAVNKELGITPEMAAAPEVANLSVGDKIKLVIQRAAAQSKEPVPVSEQTRIANTAIDSLMRLQQHYDAMEVAARPKALPRPSAVEGVVTVNKEGLAVTEAQWGEYMQKFNAMSPEQRATEMGLGPMGVLRKSLSEYARLRDTAAGSDKPMDARVATKARNELKRDWAKIFSNPKDTLARTNALEEYINRGGDMSYEEAAVAVGPRRSKAGRQSGILDIEGLEQNVESLKHLGDGVTKYAAAGLIRPVAATGDTMPMFRGTRAGQDTNLKPGDWITDTKDFAENVYAKGRTEGQPMGAITTHEVAVKDIVEVHPGGFIYAPTGTDLGGVVRYVDKETGKPVTFAELAAKRPPRKGQDALYADAVAREKAGIKTNPNWKQRGILDIEGLEKNLPAAQKAAKEAATTGWTVQNPELVASRVKNIMEKNREELEDSRSKLSQDLLKKARRSIYAHDYDVRVALENSGNLGKIAHDRMVVQNGATMAAKMKMDAANEAIFNKFNHSERNSLDEITRLRRIVQIDKYKGIGKVRHEGGITGPEAAVRIEQMQRELGGEFSKINNAATSIFEQQKMLLTDLRDNGLISDLLYDKMKDLSYTRTEYLDAIDPAIPISSHVRNMPLSIRSSGIPELGHGKKVAVNIDAQQLLMEDMARVENRIFRNNTLKAVQDLAREMPENDIVRLPSKEVVKTDELGNQKMRHTPQGWTSIGVRREGKQEFILMRDEFAEQFVARPEAMPEWLAVTLRTASGTSAIKTTSTAYNPSFVVAGIPMDIFHTWLADTKVYSPHLPKYLAQIGVDMAATAKDAFTKGDEWKAAMSEGIGSSYLTHESRSLTDPSKSIRSQMSPHLAKTRTVLSYLNDTTDMWLRLAYRRRLMESGMESWRATAAARDRLDYYQGGHVVKAFDTFIPYANVAVQGTGKIIEAGAKDPSRMVVKSAWFVATAASATLANMISSPETQKAISVDDKVRNFNITFGDQYYTLDQNGNKRYMYVPIRIDQTVMPLMAGVIGGLEKAEYGKVPDGLVGSAFGQISPVNKALPIPMADAVASYISNYDTFTARQIYTGPVVKPESEIRTFGTGKPTSPVAVAAGGLTGLSPMRLEAAAGKLINTNNAYIQMMSGANKLIFQGTNPREQAASTMLMLQEVPMLRNIIKLTSPGIDDMKDMRDAEEVAGSKAAPLKAGLDDLMFQFNHKQNGVTEKTISTYINNQPGEMRQQLADHFKYGATVDKILKTYKASDGIPNRAWWIHSSKIKPEVRGQVFYNEWISAKPEDRQRMMRIANSLNNAGLGYLSEDFQRSFASERKMLGDEQR